MKLIIKRDQSAKKGLFGGHKGMSFSLFTKVEINAEEQALIEKYKAGEQGLIWRSSEGVDVPILTIQQLIQGTTKDLRDVGALLDFEDEVKGACENFKNYLLVMASFGGEEIVEI